MVQEKLKQTEEKMKKAIADFEQELKSIRTGRASAALLDNIRFDYYGTLTPLKSAATVSTPEPNLIVVQPWDTSQIPAIEKAILTSDLGITPSNDGRVVRLPVPPLTEERRKQMVKTVAQMAEQHRVAVRKIRQEGRDQVQKLEKDKKVSEDDAKKGLDKIQEFTDGYIRKIDEITKRKEAELMKI
jgi:ribosome recycling factor